MIHASDLCITAEYPTFLEVEGTIEEALGELTKYYRINSLRANPDKTQVITFHLRNREDNRLESSMESNRSGEHPSSEIHRFNSYVYIIIICMFFIRL